MDAAQAIRTCLRKSFQFSGRASRSEYWWFAGLMFLVVSSAFLAFPSRMEMSDVGLIETAFNCMFLCVPWAGLAILPLAIRRLRDANIAGWVFALPALVASAMTFGLTTGYIDFNFAETTAGSAAYWSWSGIQSTGFLLFCLITVPLLSLWMIGICLFPSSTSTLSNPYGPNPLEASK